MLAFQVVRWAALLAAITCWIASAQATARARRELSETGQRQLPTLWFLGPHAGKKYFTAVGWREQRRAYAFTWLGFTCTAIFLVTSIA
jgi:hypothetical protein